MLSNRWYASSVLHTESEGASCLLHASLLYGLLTWPPWQTHIPLSQRKQVSLLERGGILRLVRNAELGVLPVEDGQEVFQEHVTVDLDVFSRVALNAAKALSAANLGVGQFAAIN